MTLAGTSAITELWAKVKQYVEDNPSVIGGRIEPTVISTALGDPVTDIITAASGISISYAGLVKWGNVLSLRLIYTYSSDISVPANGNITDILVGTLVEDFCPVILTAWQSYGDNAGIAMGYIGDTGNVYIGSFEGTGSARTIAAGTQIDTLATIVLNNTYTMSPGLPASGGNLTFDDIYPVGSIYMSMSSTNPSLLFGGTWDPIPGRFLVGAGDNEATGNQNLNLAALSVGGEKNHPLTEAETPVHAHTHSFTQPTVSGGSVSSGITGGSHHHQLRRQASNKTLAKGTWGYDEGYVESGGGTITNGSATTDTTHTHNLPSHSHSVSGGAVGARAYPSGTSASNTTAHNNLPPYLAVYIWKRVA